MVRPLSHVDGDRGGAIGNGSHSDGGAAHAHGGDTGLIGGCSNNTIPGAGNSDCPGPGGIIQGQAGPVQGQAPGGLSDAPIHIFGPGPSISPLIVGFGGERSGIGPGIGPAGSPADGQLRGIIIGPGGRLRRAGIGQGPRLAWESGDGSPSNGPGRFLGHRGPISPLIICLRGKGGGIASSIGAVGSSPQGHLGGIIAGPGRALGAPVIGQAARLGRHTGNVRPADAPLDRLRVFRAISPLVIVLRRKRGRVGPCVGGLRGSAQGQGGRVVAVPARRLRGPGVGQAAVLGGDSADGMGQGLHLVKGVLGNLPDVRVGLLVHVMGGNHLGHLLDGHQSFEVNICGHIVHSSHSGHKLENGNLTDGRGLALDRLRGGLQNEICIGHLSQVRVLSIQKNAGRGEVSRHIVAGDLRGDLTLSIDRVRYPTEFGVHHISGGLSHRGRGAPFWDTPISHGDPRIVHGTATSKHLGNKSLSRRALVAAIGE